MYRNQLILILLLVFASWNVSAQVEDDIENDDVEVIDELDTTDSTDYTPESDTITASKEKRIIGGLTVGTFHPTGDLKQLGVMFPTFGIQFGKEVNRFYHGFHLTLLRSGTDVAYTARNIPQDSTLSIDYIDATGMTWDFAYTLNRGKAIRCKAVSSVGVEVMDGNKCKDCTSNQSLIAASSFTYNLGLGLELDWYRKSTIYGLYARYNIKDYTLSNNYFLKGNTFSLGLIVRLWTEKIGGYINEELTEE